VTQTLPDRPELAAARLMLERMGISPADLLDVAPARASAPTFAEYVQVVSAAVSSGTRRVYGSYWKRVVDAWGDRRIDEPVPSEIEQLRTRVQANVVARRNARVAGWRLSIWWPRCGACTGGRWPTGGSASRTTRR